MTHRITAIVRTGMIFTALLTGCVKSPDSELQAPTQELGLESTVGTQEAAADAKATCAALPQTRNLSVGVVDCFLFPSMAMGADVPVSYWIPEACAPRTGRKCPVLYYLHGTGGDYTEGTGPNWVAALTSGPPVDPRTTSDPWTYTRSTWVPKPSIDMILIAADGQIQPGGYGHDAGQDTGWFNWNPRYALGGDSQRYDTPAPAPETFLAEELVPFVDAVFPTGSGRQWRAILGYSQGGFGSYINGLTRPDIWSSLGMESGGGLPLVALGDLADDSVLVTGVAPPASLPFLQLPGLVPTIAPDEVVNQNLVGEAVIGLGDPVADQAWWRQSNPVDLIPNVRAWSADGTQSTHLKHFVNDAVPRRPEDYVLIASGGALGEGYEALLFPMNLYMEHVFDRHGVERTFNVGPGFHWDPYQSPYFREQLEAQYSNLRHWDGGGNPRPDPAVFDYRTIHTDFTIWGWAFVVQRAAVEFLNLTDVSCAGLTLRGTGQVTVTVPRNCGTGLGGERKFSVDLGPSQPVDEMAGLGTSHPYGKTVTVTLARLHGP